MTAFEEFINPIVKEVTIFSEIQTLNLFDELDKLISFTSWGRIDQNKSEFEVISNESLIIKRLTSSENIKIDTEVIVLWDGSHVPAIQASLKTILDNIDSITSISFDTWILSKKYKFIIEFYHTGEIVLAHFD